MSAIPMVTPNQLSPGSRDLRFSDPLADAEVLCIHGFSRDIPMAEATIHRPEMQSFHDGRDTPIGELLAKDLKEAITTKDLREAVTTTESPGRDWIKSSLRRLRLFPRVLLRQVLAEAVTSIIPERGSEPK